MVSFPTSPNVKTPTLRKIIIQTTLSFLTGFFPWDFLEKPGKNDEKLIAMQGKPGDVDDEYSTGNS